MNDLAYDEDIRDTDPNKSGHRRARFRQGWRSAVEGRSYGDKALRELTWDNLGHRLGRLFGDASDEMIDTQYDWCVHQQKSKGGGLAP